MANIKIEIGRADLLFKETIEMIASCYNQHFDVSIVIYVLSCGAIRYIFHES